MDPSKIKAIRDMPVPTDITGVRCFLGMVNYLGKFIAKLSDLTELLRQLLKESNVFIWREPQDAAFKRIKDVLCSPVVLQHYDVNKTVRLSADSSSFGVGAVLEQPNKEGLWKPIAYASRSLSESEKRLAQIEKEALAITWASDRFSSYILGKKITIITDHKPLVSILGQKKIDNSWCQV